MGIAHLRENLDNVFGCQCSKNLLTFIPKIMWKKYASTLPKKKKKRNEDDFSPTRGE